MLGLTFVAEEDILVIQDTSNPEWMWHGDVTLDGKYLILHVSRDSSRVSKIRLTMSKRISNSTYGNAEKPAMDSGLN